MKRFFALFISVFLIGSCATIASAEEATYSTAGELFQAWEENYPDYICGVWSTDGGHVNLTFGIQNNELGNAGKQEILNLVENDSTISFVYQVFSRNYLVKSQKGIDAYSGKDLGLVSTSVDEINNRIVLGVLEERKDTADTQKMIEAIQERYANAVSIEYTDEFPHDELPHIDNYYKSKASNTHPFLFLIFGAAILLLSAMTFAHYHKKNMAVLQTNNGTTVLTTASLSAKEVEDMIKKSSCSIPSDLDQKVMHVIDRKR